MTIADLQAEYPQEIHCPSITEKYLTRIEAIDKQGRRSQAARKLNTDALAMARLQIKNVKDKVRAGPMPVYPGLIKSRRNRAHPCLLRSLSAASAMASASVFSSSTLLIAGPCLSIAQFAFRYFSVIRTGSGIFLRISAGDRQWFISSSSKGLNVGSSRRGSDSRVLPGRAQCCGHPSNTLVC